jgi:hypothetical protein
VISDELERWVDVSDVLEGSAASIYPKRRHLPTKLHGYIPPENSAFDNIPTLEKLKRMRILTTGTKLADRRARNNVSLGSIRKGSVSFIWKLNSELNSVSNERIRSWTQ